MVPILQRTGKIIGLGRFSRTRYESAREQTSRRSACLAAAAPCFSDVGLSGTNAARGSINTTNNTKSMKRPGLVVAALFMSWVGLANGRDLPGEKDFVRTVVQSLVTNGETLPFDVADQVVAMDNGEVLSKEDFRKAWPGIAKIAFKKKLSVDEFFTGVALNIQPVADNKRIMGNKKLLEAYKPQEGDMYCDASHMKDGVANFIGYDKAFIYIIRKVSGKWVLIGIGG